MVPYISEDSDSDSKPSLFPDLTIRVYGGTNCFSWASTHFSSSGPLTYLWEIIARSSITVRGLWETMNVESRI